MLVIISIPVGLSLAKYSRYSKKEKKTIETISKTSIRKITPRKRTRK